MIIQPQIDSTPSILTRFLDGLFAAFQRRHLIYNACIEDPAVDRAALDLSPRDRVLVVTSGGCNALDYLLAGAGEVDAVDLNPCQRALLGFKVAAIRGLDHAAFWESFFAGRSPRAREIYHDAAPGCRRGRGGTGTDISITSAVAVAQFLLLPRRLGSGDGPDGPLLEGRAAAPRAD